MRKDQEPTTIETPVILPIISDSKLGKQIISSLRANGASGDDTEVLEKALWTGLSLLATMQDKKCLSESGFLGFQIANWLHIRTRTLSIYGWLVDLFARIEYPLDNQGLPISLTSEEAAMVDGLAKYLGASWDLGLSTSTGNVLLGSQGFGDSNSRSAVLFVASCLTSELIDNSYDSNNGGVPRGQPIEMVFGPDQHNMDNLYCVGALHRGNITGSQLKTRIVRRLR